MSTYSDEQLARLLPYPSSDANKYSRGKLVLVVGSAAYPGAACMAAAAAQRSGAGYCEVFTASKNVPPIQVYRPSLVVRDWGSMGTEFRLKPTTDRSPVAYLVGSGFDSRDAEAAEKLEEALSVEAPLLIDGGALGMLSDSKLMTMLQARGDSGLLTVLTPHGGEASALAKALDVEEPSDPAQFAALLASMTGAVIVLKGPSTYVADPDSRVECMDEGTPALAKAGTGDVLAGIIGAFLAQGLGGVDAAMLGATVHARAGKNAALIFTTIGACPEDVLDFVPTAFKSFVETE